MPLSLYQATVPTFLQVTGAVRGLLDKAENYCAENGLDPKTLIEGRLTEDMWNFAFQIQNVAAHSFGAIEGVKAGLFTPVRDTPPADFPALKALIDNAISGLNAVDEGELEGVIGNPMRFEAGELKLHFTAETFLLHFSQPNFFFHAVTAYDILRAKGLPVGKLDYLAGMPMKRG